MAKAIHRNDDRARHADSTAPVLWVLFALAVTAALMLA
jgi:hypothetical protein